MTYKEVNNDIIKEDSLDYYDEYNYWQIQEQLTPWIEVKKDNTLPTGATVIKTIYKWAGSWTWYITITWLWTVTSCEVFAWEDDDIWQGWRWSRSVSEDTPAGSKWMYMQDNTWKTTNRIIHISNDASGSSVKAYIEEYVTDWIKFNFSTDDKNIYYTIIAHN